MQMAVQRSCQTEQRDKSGGIEEFLDKLDEFDLNEYIKAIRFDEMKVPALPFQLPVSKVIWHQGNDGKRA